MRTSRKKLQQQILLNLSARTRVRKNWANFWRKRGRKAEIDWKHITYTHVDQTDNYNCGVYACYFFKLLLQGKF